MFFKQFWVIILGAGVCIIPFLHVSSLTGVVSGNFASVMSLHDQTEETLEWFQKAQQNSLDKTVSYIMEGRWLYQSERYSESIAKLKLALELAPDNRAAQYFLGLALTETGRIEEAVVQFRKIDLDKMKNQFFDILTNFGWDNVLAAKESSSLSSREWIKAERYYQASLMLFPDTWQKWKNLAVFYLEWSDDPEKGIAILREAEAHFSENELPNLELARYFRKRERYMEALQELETAFIKAPRNPEVYEPIHFILHRKPEIEIDEWCLRLGRNLSPSDQNLVKLNELCESRLINRY